MTVFITKHALTSGIREVKAIIISGTAKGFYKGVGFGFFPEGTEWHRTRESAVTRANDMRRRKIESLRKQIERLEGLEF